MEPVIKWAGGKRQLLDEISDRLPKSYNRYFEPFIGGAAVLFDVQPKNAVINDINPLLINMYCQIRDNSSALISKIKDLDAVDCDKELYLANREKYNEKISKKEMDTEAAALMIWINKHCFNGLYRVNRKGLFNVPYNNKKKGQSIDPDNIRAISSYLASNPIEIKLGDFEEACKDAKEGDFVYFDSPYVPESDSANFTGYASDGFPEEEHIRLANLFRELDKKGVLLMLSNNDVPFVRDLYKGYNIDSIGVKRLINRDADKRTGQEVIIRNYV